MALTIISIIASKLVASQTTGGSSVRSTHSMRSIQTVCVNAQPLAITHVATNRISRDFPMIRKSNYYERLPKYQSISLSN